MTEKVFLAAPLNNNLNLNSNLNLNLKGSP